MSAGLTEKDMGDWLSSSLPPVHIGWYLVQDPDDRYTKSGLSPKYDFPSTVWRYWSGYNWWWFGEAFLTDDGTDGKLIWRKAKIHLDTPWRGLRIKHRLAVPAFHFKTA